MSPQRNQQFLPQVGDVVERYRLVQKIGQGAFGVVFRASQLGLEADVAVKFLLPPDGAQNDTHRIVDRFRQEARVAKELQHPCALKIRDYGETESGLLYLVSEFIAGRTLEDVITDGPLNVERTVRIAHQTLGCLAEAHHRGIIHRDLKPGNIMLRDIFGERDSVKVLDFGVAKVREERGGVRTQTGQGFGTPLYISPEQCRGVRDLDGRLDLYAMGLVMAECLTGRRVVTATDQMAAIYTHASQAPHRFEPTVRQSALWPVIECACRKDRNQRFPNAIAMRDAIVQTVGGYSGESVASVGSHSSDAPLSPPPVRVSTPFDPEVAALETTPLSDLSDTVRMASDDSESGRWPAAVLVILLTLIAFAVAVLVMITR